MIIWINGAFGAGKTTLAQELERRLPEALPFDPEYVGYILVKWVPPADSGDFQDIPLWRRLVAEFAIGMSAELHRRIDAQVLVEDDPVQDAEARAFRHRNAERCIQARDGLPADTLILRGDQHTPAELADLVLSSVAVARPPR